jgi:ABC-2 type transport system permease protein
VNRGAVVTQTRTELLLTLRRGESLLLTFGIPLLLLVFFSRVDALPVPTDEPVDYLAPRILALAVLGTAMVNLAISTGFERQYGVLKRLGATPLGRPSLLAAKTLQVLGILAMQAVVLTVAALLLEWDPSFSLAAPVAVIIAAVAFAGAGFLLAGTLKAEATLAVANGLYLLLLLLGGVAVPLDELPGPIEAVASQLPVAALGDILEASLGAGQWGSAHDWLVLLAWAVALPALAARFFRWE